MTIRLHKPFRPTLDSRALYEGVDWRQPAHQTEFNRWPILGFLRRIGNRLAALIGVTLLAFAVSLETSGLIDLLGNVARETKNFLRARRPIMVMSIYERG